MKFFKILKIAFVSAMVVFVTFLAIRMFMTSDRSALNSIYPTEGAVSAYAALGKDAFKTHSLLSDMSEDGYYTAYGLTYCESEKELQITVRYNESLSENYLIGSDPENYYFELRDSKGNTIARSEAVEEKERYFYRHLRLAFSDVDLDDYEEVYLFLISEECSYPAEHTEGILIHHPSIEFKSYKLSKSEIEALTK